MAKWAFLAVILYIILVMVLFLPAACALADIIAGEDVSLSEYFELYGPWVVCFFVIIVIVIQAGLLFYPVKIADKAFPLQRHIWIPAVATAFAFSVIVIGIIWSVLAAIWGDDILQNYVALASLAFVVANYLIWSCLFYSFASGVGPKSFISRLTRWLLQGSIVELLVAVPSHIIVRHKNVCCAQGLTFLGIATGVVIMALAFGPGLFFLFRKRFEKMKPKSKRNNHQIFNQYS